MSRNNRRKLLTKVAVEVKDTYRTLLFAINEELLGEEIFMSDFVDGINDVPGQEVVDHYKGTTFAQIDPRDVVGDDNYQIKFIMVLVTNPKFLVNAPQIKMLDYDTPVAEGAPLLIKTFDVNHGVYDMDELLVPEFFNIINQSLPNEGRIYTSTLIIQS